MEHLLGYTKMKKHLKENLIRKEKNRWPKHIKVAMRYHIRAISKPIKKSKNISIRNYLINGVGWDHYVSYFRNDRKKKLNII